MSGSDDAHDVTGLYGILKRFHPDNAGVNEKILAVALWQTDDYVPHPATCITSSHRLLVPYLDAENAVALKCEGCDYRQPLDFAMMCMMLGHAAVRFWQLQLTQLLPPLTTEQAEVAARAIADAINAQQAKPPIPGDVQ